LIAGTALLLALSSAPAGAASPLFAPGPRAGEWQPGLALRAGLLWGTVGLVGGGLSGAALDLASAGPRVPNAVSFALVGAMVGSTAGVHRFSAARWGYEGLGALIGGTGGVIAGSLVLLVGQAAPVLRPVTVVAFYGAMLGGSVAGAWVAGDLDSRRDAVAVSVRPWVGDAVGARLVATW
jgi:hypothetical protein